MTETTKPRPFQDLPRAEQETAIDTETDAAVLDGHDKVLAQLGYAENNRLRMRLAIRRSALTETPLSEEFRARASAIGLEGLLPPKTEE
jgi:hypothetical protein